MGKILIISIAFLITGCQSYNRSIDESIERFVAADVEQYRNIDGLLEYRYCNGNFPDCKPLTPKTWDVESTRTLSTKYLITPTRPVISQVPDLENSVLFNFDSYWLTPEAITFLKGYLPKLQNKNILITGFTDNVGAIEYNSVLAKQRAESVKQYFIQLGIPQDNIMIDYKANCCFVADDDYLNRRVEIQIQ